MRNIQTLRHRQSGATLIIGMIILILLMMIGLTSMKTSDIQFQLAGNLQFENAAMNNAETTLHTAETWLRTGSNYRNAGLDSDACNSRSVNHLYPLNQSVTPPHRVCPAIARPATTR